MSANKIDSFKLRAEFGSLIFDVLKNLDRLCEIIKIIGVDDGDDEVAHRMEDELRENYLKTICTPEAEKILSLKELPFARWCA